MFPLSKGGFLCFLKKGARFWAFRGNAQWVSIRKSYYLCDTSHVTFADVGIRGSKSRKTQTDPRGTVGTQSKSWETRRNKPCSGLGGN